MIPCRYRFETSLYWYPERILAQAASNLLIELEYHGLRLPHSVLSVHILALGGVGLLLLMSIALLPTRSYLVETRHGCDHGRSDFDRYSRVSRRGVPPYSAAQPLVS